VASQVIHAMKLKPKLPSDELQLGSESLLSMTVTDAARYYDVAGDVVGRRLRPPAYVDLNQMKLAIA